MKLERLNKELEEQLLNEVALLAAVPRLLSVLRVVLPIIIEAIHLSSDEDVQAAVSKIGELTGKEEELAKLQQILPGVSKALQRFGL